MATTLCTHNNSLTTGIDVVCVDCGLVLETRPFDIQSDSWNEDISDRLLLDARRPSSRRLKVEIAEVCRCLGIEASRNLINSLSSDNLYQGKLRHVALARVYSHFRHDIPLDYVLDVLGVSLHAATRALKAEGVYSDEPEDTIVGFAVRRSKAPPEAYQECLVALRNFPTLSRRVVVAAVIAEWVGVEISAQALAVSTDCVRSSLRTLNKLREKST